jgi:PII-like signaling protein
VEAEVRLTGSALRLTVYIGENDTWRHKPLFAEIVHRARAAGLAGASVFRGVEGFGASSLIHTSRLLSLSEDLPVAVVVVDTEERVRAFLPQLDGLVTEGLVTLDPCEVVHYTGRGADAHPGKDAGRDPDDAAPAAGQAGDPGGPHGGHESGDQGGDEDSAPGEAR